MTFYIMTLIKTILGFILIILMVKLILNFTFLQIEMQNTYYIDLMIF